MASEAGILDVNVPNFITIALMVALLGALFGLASKFIQKGRKGGGKKGGGNSSLVPAPAASAGE